MNAQLTREQRVICRLIAKRGIATYEQAAQAYLDNNEPQLLAWKEQLKQSQMPNLYKERLDFYSEQNAGEWYMRGAREARRDIRFSERTSFRNSQVKSPTQLEAFADEMGYTTNALHRQAFIEGYKNQVKVQ